MHSYLRVEEGRLQLQDDFPVLTKLARGRDETDARSPDALPQGSSALGPAFPP